MDFAFNPSDVLMLACVQTTESGDISIQDIDIDEGMTKPLLPALPISMLLLPPPSLYSHGAALGFFLVLSNKSTRTVDMGGWSLTVNNEDVEETFTFPQE